MLLRTPVDIFPEINIPVVSIIWTYNGLVPSEMEKRITSIYERALTTTVGNVEHIESQSLNGVAVIKVFLQPQANVDGAIAEVNAEAQATHEAASSGHYASAGDSLQRIDGAHSATRSQRTRSLGAATE